jgi:methylenetetrahydrofolate dehydrogenase (NADP+) / methenyltetrahydrofolate cyclohydrolase
MYPQSSSALSRFLLSSSFSPVLTFSLRSFSSAAPASAASVSASSGPRWLVGRDLATSIETRLSQLTRYFTRYSGLRPGLATILVGSDRSSHRYVARKQETAARLGFHSLPFQFNETQLNDTQLYSLLSDLNRDPAVHGILVQLPLPVRFNENLVLSSVLADKDVDGFHPFNVGKLVVQQLTTPGSQFQPESGMRLFPSYYTSPQAPNIPCTPKACMLLLDSYGIPIRGKSVLIVNTSKIVGLPLSHLLLHHGATVSLAHSRTDPDHLRILMRQADIVITAVGKANFVDGKDLKPGATVIDVGINFVPRNSQHANSLVSQNPVDSSAGLMMVGDCSPSVRSVASHLTPVPGGVGPLTVAMLMENTFINFLHLVGKHRINDFLGPANESVRTLKQLKERNEKPNVEMLREAVHLNEIVEAIATIRLNELNGFGCAESSFTPASAPQSAVNQVAQEGKSAAAAAHRELTELIDLSSSRVAWIQKEFVEQFAH